MLKDLKCPKCKQTYIRCDDEKINVHQPVKCVCCCQEYDLLIQHREILKPVTDQEAKHDKK